MPSPKRRVPWAASLLALSLPLGLIPAEAQVQPASAREAVREAVRDYDLPAGQLAATLNRIAREAGLALTVEASSLQGLTAPGIRGRLTPQQALRRAAENSGMDVVRTDAGTYTLRPADPLRPRSLSEQGDPSNVAEPGEKVLPTVTVTAQDEREKLKDQPYRTAGSTSVLTRDDIERFRGTSVGDIFQGMPGVLVGENRNSGGLDVNIRGMQGQGRVPILVDGARQETTVYRGYAGVSSRSYVDPDLIGGIEVSKGPVMGVEGTGATGGAVAMHTLTAEDILKPGERQGVRIRGSIYGNSSAAPPPNTVSGINGLGTYRTDCAVPSLCSGAYAMPASFGSSEGMDRPSSLDFYSYAVSVAGARRYENLDLVAAVAKRRQGNYYAGTRGPAPQITLAERKLPFYTEVTADYEGATRFRAGERIVNSNNDSNSVLLKGKLYLPDEQTLELGYLRYESQYGELMPSQLMWFDQVKQTGNSNVTANTLSARHRWNPQDNDWVDLSSSLWFTRTKTINRSYSSDNYDSLNLEGASEPERYKRVGGSIGNVSAFRLWGSHKLSYGATFQREDIKTKFDPGQFAAETGRSGDRQEYSAYANWNWQPRPEWTLEYGLRYLRTKTHDDKPVVPTGSYQCAYDSDGNCAEQVYVPSVYCVDGDGDGGCDPIIYQTRNSGTVPTFSITWEPWRNGFQLYARHAEALRAPSLFEATQGWSAQPGLDVPLRPEHAVNREIGMNFLQRGVWRSSDRLGAKLAYFKNRTDNYLTRTSPNTWEDGNQTFVVRNIKNVKLHGIEANFDYDAGPAYTRLSATRYNFIEVCHYGSYRRNECNDYGVANSYFNNMVPPKWHASAIFGVRPLGQKLDIGTRLTWMGKRNPTPEFNDDTARGFLKVVPWHAYTLVDLYARYRHSDRLSFDLNIDNATDQYYLDALSLGLVPAPGRTVRLSMTISF